MIRSRPGGRDEGSELAPSLSCIPPLWLGSTRTSRQRIEDLLNLAVVSEDNGVGVDPHQMHRPRAEPARSTALQQRLNQLEHERHLVPRRVAWPVPRAARRADLADPAVAVARGILAVDARAQRTHRVVARVRREERHAGRFRGGVGGVGHGRVLL
jgi:hypothetical protein